MPSSTMVRSLLLVSTCIVASLGAGSIACSSRSAPPAETPTTTTVSAPVETTAKITMFSVSPENLSVDKISMREGSAIPDGNRDLVFTTRIDGPVNALFLVTCTQKGDPLHNFRADTVMGQEELPAELGTVVDVGRMTEWIAIVEDGKFINHENSRIDIRSGSHDLKLYVPNTGMLRGGSFIRLYARAQGGTLVAGPVVPY
ncbi:hypothetical protein AKJ09_08607 [Labilithrix luteola]|uniref:Lipoprotein n=1 Tax=Labilithrix luteola TaxID=1391654 RepID=A0A0K1Q889_9BACT|nr:hypothetical protein [Labilithrix luteola]AKV01944.1 hypothetical protein AKJ09_08607 [Labilithrix luteola]